MSESSSPQTGLTIHNVLMANRRSGRSVRLITGLGINVVGAAVLSAHGVRFLGGSI